jgi:hypothetical protein
MEKATKFESLPPSWTMFEECLHFDGVGPASSPARVQNFIAEIVGEHSGRIFAPPGLTALSGLVHPSQSILWEGKTDGPENTADFSGTKIKLLDTCTDRES